MIWKCILDWMLIDNVPGIWSDEIKWIIYMSNNKGSKSNILKRAFAETIYQTWKYRNDICFGNETSKSLIGNKIIHYCVWMLDETKA